jgi:uncharacterized protein YidB (DUF937 family)
VIEAVIAAPPAKPQNRGLLNAYEGFAMGLLDSVIGALGQAQGGGGAQPDLLGAVIGMLGQGGGSGGAAGSLGGLAGLVEKFAQSGLGDQVQSWISTGQNMPVTGDQVSSALGADTLSRMAQQLGMGQGDLAAQLSELLPQVVDKLTPNGQLPDMGQGAGGLGDLAGMLGGLLKR